MTTLTLNRSLDGNDCLFVALNDGCYADWKASQNSMIDWEDDSRVVENDSLVSRIKKFFSAR